MKTRRLVLDHFSEVFNLLESYADETFFDFSQVDPVPGSIYIIGRQQLIDNTVKVREMCESGLYIMIFGNSAEAAWTLEMQLYQLKIRDLVLGKKLLLISGGPMLPEYPALTHEHFLTKILDFPETLQAQHHIDSIFSKLNKPYKFLFLNGRARPHRKYLYERFLRSGLLDQCLWTMLDSKPTLDRKFDFVENGIDIMATPTTVKRLPDDYEVPRYRYPEFGPIVPGRTMLKQELFRTEWGEIYLTPEPYVDTYFSLVTETICAESDLSFRTEKMAKPLAIGHPFIVAANRGFYRDLHDQGFQTFSHVIDESFDSIDNPQTRMDRLIEITADLCDQNLDSFLAECYNVCKYNQHRLNELNATVRQQFPDRFFQFLKAYD